MSKLNSELALKIIPEFSGSPSEVHKIISCCDIIAKPLTEKTDTAQFIALLSAKLSGKAYNVIKYKTFTTWNELKAEIISQFSDTRSLEQVQNELVTIRQQSNESVRAYANRVEELLWILNDLCIEAEGKDSANVIININSRSALKSFQEGLMDPLKIIIKACRFSFLKDAVAKAIEEELCLKNNNEPSTSTSFRNKNYTNSNNQISRPKSFSFNKNTNSSFIVKCQICRKPGHTSNICYQRFNNSFQNNFPSNALRNNQHPDNKSVRKASVICNYCKLYGHLLKDCRKKKYWDSQTVSRNSNQPPNNNEVNIVQSDLNETGLVAQMQNTLRVQDL